MGRCAEESTGGGRRQNSANGEDKEERLQEKDHGCFQLGLTSSKSGRRCVISASLRDRIKHDIICDCPLAHAITFEICICLKNQKFQVLLNCWARGWWPCEQGAMYDKGKPLLDDPCLLQVDTNQWLP